jgi:CRP-like cAMP-binding protein
METLFENYAKIDRQESGTGHFGYGGLVIVGHCQPRDVAVGTRVFAFCTPASRRSANMLYASNAILASLTERDLRTLGPHLKPVHLTQKTILYESGEFIPSIYFPTKAVISLVVTLATGETSEAAMVGRDGAAGIASALDGKIAINRAIVQLSGEAFSCDPAAFRGVAMQSENLISIVMRHEQTIFAQAQQSTACMANHDVEARLCRWLLRARDISGSDELPFTQEFLGEMLGVRRTSVTIVAKRLQATGMIKYTRGHIQILDVEGLQDATCECFETVKQQYRQLLLNPNSGD